MADFLTGWFVQEHSRESSEESQTRKMNFCPQRVDLLVDDVSLERKYDTCHTEQNVHCFDTYTERGN